MTVVSCSVDERYVNPLFEVFDGGDFILSSWRDVEDPRTEMSIFFPDPADAPRATAALVAAGRLVGLELAPQMRSFPDEDWKLAYRRHFKTETISPRLAVVPVWERAAWEGRAPSRPCRTVCGRDGARPSQSPTSNVQSPNAVFLDPGMAFGTGQHATTHACLEFVDELAAANADRSFLDVGCGSGILALAAAKCGFREVAGFDVDADAVRVANEMAVENGLAPFFTRGDLCNVSTLPGMTHAHGADVVAANVLGPVLIRFAREIAPLVAPGGELILSGILTELYPEVVACYAALGFRETRAKVVGEWTTGLFKRG